MQDKLIKTFCTPHFCLAFVLCNGYSAEQSSAASNYGGLVGKFRFITLVLPGV
jgi:hypothetical protein